MNNTQLRIEHYLVQLDRELQAMTISQRAEIITEIKSHILDAQEKDPNREIDSILNDLGEPRAVASGYLSNKGLSAAPVKSSVGPGFKWLAWGLVGVFAILLIVTIVGVRYLTPFLKVNEKDGQVTMFGGMIDVNEKLGRVKVGDIEINEAMNGNQTLQGELELKGKKLTLVKVPFNTAKIDVSSGEEMSLKWTCQTHGSASPEFEPAIEGSIVTLNLNALTFAKCSLTLPQSVASEFHGTNGQLQFVNPGETKVTLANGKVGVKQDHSRVYDFDVAVTNGVKDKFPHSTEKGAIKVKIDVANGVVKNE